MHRTTGNRRWYPTRRFRTVILAALSVLLVAATLATAMVLRADGHAMAAPSDAGGVGSGTTVLHTRATRTGLGENSALESWLDLATNEGRIVETAPDGTARRIEVVAGNTHTLYLAEAHHVVIQHGASPSSPYRGYVRNELLGAQDAVTRGKVPVIGIGRVNGHATNRIRFTAPEDNSTITVDLDATTGLILRHETTPQGGSAQARETAYSVVEYVARTTLPASTFQVDLPAYVGREEYTDDDPSRPGAANPGLPYVVYAPPASIGAPEAAYRRTSSYPGQPSSDAYYMTYQGVNGPVRVVSSLAPVVEAPPAGKQLPGNPLKIIQVGGVAWEIPTSSGVFQGRAQLDSAYVTIFAPDQAIFEFMAGGLRRLDR